MVTGGEPVSVDDLKEVITAFASSDMLEDAVRGIVADWMASRTYWYGTIALVVSSSAYARHTVTADDRKGIDFTSIDWEYSNAEWYCSYALLQPGTYRIAVSGGVYGLGLSATKPTGSGGEPSVSTEIDDGTDQTYALQEETYLIWWARHGYMSASGSVSTYLTVDKVS